MYVCVLIYLGMIFLASSLGKNWQAEGNLPLYRTDYLVTDHLAGKFLCSGH